MRAVVVLGIVCALLIALALVRLDDGCRVNFDVPPTEETWACWWEMRQGGALVCPQPHSDPEWEKLTLHFGCA